MNGDIIRRCIIDNTYSLYLMTILTEVYISRNIIKNRHNNIMVPMLGLRKMSITIIERIK